MKKIEQVYREIVFQVMEMKKNVLTQSELSSRLSFSLSTVNLAVNKLDRIGAVIVGNRNFRVIDIKKILYYWASIRNIGKNIIYTTRAEISVREIERSLGDVFFACFSAYKLKFKDVPADYSEVYVYASEEQLNKIKKRFEDKKGVPNLIIMKEDWNMKRYGKTLTIGQIFVDLWNLKQWYAKDFLEAMDEKINNSKMGEI